MHVSLRLFCLFLKNFSSLVPFSSFTFLLFLFETDLYFEITPYAIRKKVRWYWRSFTDSAWWMKRIAMELKRIEMVWAWASVEEGHIATVRRVIFTVRYIVIWMNKYCFYYFFLVDAVEMFISVCVQRWQFVWAYELTIIRKVFSSWRNWIKDTKTDQSWQKMTNFYSNWKFRND